MTMYRMFLLLFMVAGSNFVTPVKAAGNPLNSLRFGPRTDAPVFTGFLGGMFSGITILSCAFHLTTIEPAAIFVAAGAGLLAAVCGTVAYNKIKNIKNEKERKEAVKTTLRVAGLGFCYPFLPIIPIIVAGLCNFDGIWTNKEQTKTIFEKYDPEIF
jgi:hypothetical protein